MGNQLGTPYTVIKITMTSASRQSGQLSNLLDLIDFVSLSETTILVSRKGIFYLRIRKRSTFFGNPWKPLSIAGQWFPHLLRCKRRLLRFSESSRSHHHRHEFGFPFYRSALKSFTYRVFFLTGPSLNLLSVGQEITDFKKTHKSQTAPPPMIENV